MIPPPCPGRRCWTDSEAWTRVGTGDWISYFGRGNGLVWVFLNQSQKVDAQFKSVNSFKISGQGLAVLVWTLRYVSKRK